MTLRIPHTIGALRLFVLAAALTACTKPGGAADACDSLPLEPAARCMSYRVIGDFGLVDNLQVDVLYQDISTSAAKYHVRRISSTPVEGTASEPPLRFAIALGPESVPSKIRVVAKLGATPVAYGTTGLQLNRADRKQMDLELDGNLIASTCFDGRRNGSELDVDCEGDSAFTACPYCVVGQRCEDDLDCVESICDRQSGVQYGVCRVAP